MFQKEPAIILDNVSQVQLRRYTQTKEYLKLNSYRDNKTRKSLLTVLYLLNVTGYPYAM